MHKNMKKAVFLDRDGLLIEDVGFISRTEDVHFFPFTFASLRRLQEKFILFIVTNQAGIAAGVTSESEVAAVNNYILHTLKNEGIAIAELFCCPHSDKDKCKCRKPSPYFAHVAAKKHNVDLSKSYMIGDHPSDVRFADNFGGTGLYVLTGHGKNHLDDAPKQKIFPSLKEAADWILSLSCE